MRLLNLTNLGVVALCLFEKLYFASLIRMINSLLLANTQIVGRCDSA